MSRLILITLLFFTLYAKQGFSDGCNTTGFTIIPSCNPGDNPLIVKFNPGASSDEPNNTNYYWDFGDGQTFTQVNNGTAIITHTYATAGTYTINLHVAVGPAFSNFFSGKDCYLTQVITIGNPILSQSLSASTICNGGNLGQASIALSFTTGVQWEWDPVSTTAVLNPSSSLTISNLTAGPHIVLIQNGACIYTHTFDVQLPGISNSVTTQYNPITGGVIPNISCSGFNDGSASVACINCATPVTFTWSNGFVDAPTSTVSSQSNLTVGNYTVTYSDINGCVNSTTLVLTEPPPLNYTLSLSPTLCGSVAIGSATITSITGGAAPYNIQWFDNTTLMTNNNLANGTHTVMVRDNNNCKTISSFTINNTLKPTATVTTSNVCINDPASFIATVTVSALGATYDWDFGDSAPHSNLLTPSHLYTNTGNYNVIFTVSDLNGCVTLVNMTVTAHPKPIATFAYNNVCIYSSFTFTNASSIALPDNISSYTYNFGDGTPLINGTIASHQYATAGNYTVSLHLVSNHSCFIDAIYPVTIFPKPTANFKIDSICVNTPPALFINQSTISAPDAIANNSWAFGDAQTSIIQSPMHVYLNSGVYSATLLVVSNHGCRDSITKPVKILEKPNALFVGDKLVGCSPVCPQFTYIGGSQNITNYSWTYDHATSNQTNPNHCFISNSSSSSISFSVGLIVKNKLGCFDTASLLNYITVNPNPVANYTVVPEFGSVVVPLVHFINQSIDYTSLYWQFGDGKTDNSTINPNHYYEGTTSDDYYSSLIVTNQYGCTDTARIKVNIAPEFIFYIPNTFSPNGDNINDGFIGVGIGIEKYEMWIFDRWGAMIYYTNDIYKPWNGKLQGKDIEAKQDVYTWKVELKDVFNKKHNYVGHVTLLR